MTLPTLPMEIVNKILIMREPHPIAKLLNHLIQNFNYYKKSLLKHRYLPNEDCYLDFKSNVVIINTYYI